MLRGTLVLGGAATAGGCSVSGPAPGPGDQTPPEVTGNITRAQPNLEKRPGSVTVGLLLPLSAGGGVAPIAKAMRQAAEMAVIEHSTADLQLVVKDDKGTPDGARAAATELIKEGAEIILGPLYSKCVTAVSPIARAAQIPVIAFSNDPTVAGGNVYLLTYLTQSEIVRVVTYAASHGRKRYMALVTDDAPGRALEPEFRSAVARAGGTVVAIERYGSEGNGMVEPIQRLRDTMKASIEEGGRVDAIFIPASEDVLPQLAAVLPNLDADTDTVKMLGTSGWGAATIAGDGRLFGAWYASPDPRGWREFSERFGKTYKTMPPRLASLAYDAIGIAATFAGEPAGSRYTSVNLARSWGFAGSDGMFRFAPNGLIERDLAILELKEYGPTIIDAAPTPLQAAPAAAPPGASAGLNLQGARP
jgi:branched-chain amino acid transport system substrate-binding protein